MIDKASKRHKRRIRIKKHIRKTVRGTPERPRLLVYRSLKSIYAQVVDDTSRKTLFGVSSLTKTLAEDIKKAKDKTAQARIVGKAIAEEAKKQNIEKVFFDRNGYLYHGRVKAVADGAREAGLKF
jgi:large subunit ribosomal protein L18